MKEINPYKRITELEKAVNMLKLAFLVGIVITDVILLASYLGE